MRIGLIRHFKVKLEFPKKFLVSYDEVLQLLADYEQADVETKEVEMRGVTWDQCYASSATRALKTATHIYSGSIITRHDLQELNFLPLMNKRYKLPIILWALLIRSKSKSGNSVALASEEKLSNFVDVLMSGGGENVLVATHGLVMMYLRKELIKRGFKGEKFRTPANGKIYIFSDEHG
jgi:broad specificity phosphatase PhoE